MKRYSESGGGGSTPTSGLPLAYEHLAFFEDKRCALPEHESAVKRAIQGTSRSGSRRSVPTIARTSLE